MLVTKVFQNGNSQAIRIPQDLRTEKKDYFIRKIGETYIAFPADDPWGPARQVIGTFPSEYMEDRDQPSWGMVAERTKL